MRIHLNHHSGEPIYTQIVEAIKYAVAAGQVASDSRLPSIRALADQLKINARTVVKAYEELEHAGVVVMRQGQGVFIAESQAAPASVRQQTITAMVRRLLAEAARLGATPEEVQAIVQTESQKMEAAHDSRH
jgi:GntR family transcriptional regulator